MHKIANVTINILKGERGSEKIILQFYLLNKRIWQEYFSIFYELK